MALTTASTTSEGTVGFLPLVRKVAYQLVGRLPQSVEVDDLISTGVLGLIDAVDRFDGSRAHSFPAYAEIRIRGAMLDALRKEDWVPRSVRQRVSELDAEEKNLAQGLGRRPNHDELAEARGMSSGDFDAHVRYNQPLLLVSYDEVVESGVWEAEAPGPDEDMVRNPESLTSSRRLTEALAGAIDELADKERLVLSLYYFEDMSLKEIGLILGVTESRVSQLHGAAVESLRLIIEDREFEGQEPKRLLAA